MRSNRLVWLVGGGLAGLAAARTLLLRRRTASPAAEQDPRADELRRKLAEARDMADEREEFESAETTVDRAESAGMVAERRREVHERGRAAAEEMRSGD
jgi:hypothetical protein